MNEIEEEAIAALDQAEDTLDNIDEDGVAAKIQKEQEVIDDLTTTLAELYADGLNMNEGHFAHGISECSRMTKTEAKGDITRKIEDINNQGKTSLNAWVANNLNEVRVIRTTDHVSDTRYVWEFEDGTTVETGSDNRTHFMWAEFRNQIFDAAGPYLAKPEDRYAEGKEWAEFMVRLIQERKTEKTSTGPRTRAIEYVKTRIRNAGGYGNVRDAADYRGVYVEVNNDPPDDEDPVDLDVTQQECPLWRVDLLMFPNSWAKDAAEEHDITTRAVQNELDARGMTVEGRQVSETKYVGGQYQTFWKLGGNFASPAAYQPEADDDDTDTGSDSDVDGDDTAEDDSVDESDYGGIGGEE
jgi:hypothetical protein